jgi:hypothetical protein
MMCPVAIWAQEIRPFDVKPGLWENTATTQISGIAMPTLTPEQLAQMPPQARARIEAMTNGSPQTQVKKSCVTSEQLNRPMFDNVDKSCSYKLTSSSASSQAIHVECSRGNTKTTGDLALTRIDSEHMKGDMVMKATGDRSTKGSVGESMNIKMTFSGKFLSSDCGDVKPSNLDK